MRNSLAGALLLLMSLFTMGALAADPINLAGVYECNTNPESVRKQMYLTLDFAGGSVPDLTQVFTGKEASFKLLPKDFMNAKKQKKAFAGQKAPGFGKFKSKFLFSNTYEFKLSNPRVKDGYILADWVDHDGSKGECKIIANPDRTLQILGLTKLTRDLNPDNVTLALVEDRLPAGAQPFVTPQPVADYLLGEARKLTATPKVTPFDKEIETKFESARQIGDRVEISMKLCNKSKYESLTLVVCPNRGDGSFAESKDGQIFDANSVYAVTPGTLMDDTAIKADKDKWVPFKIVVGNVKGKVDWMSKVGAFFSIAGGFFMDEHITLVENVPILQEMPEEIKPGYAEKKAAAAAAASVQLEIPQSKYVLVTGDNVNIRAAAASSGAVVAKGAKGAAYEFVAKEGTWLKIRTDGRDAFISTQVARLVSAPALKLNSIDPVAPLTFNNETRVSGKSGFESYTELKFSGKPSALTMTFDSQVAYMDGRMRAYHLEYRGKIYGGCVVLTEKSVDGNPFEPLSDPERVYAGEKEWTLRYSGLLYDAWQYDPETDQGWKLSE